MKPTPVTASLTEEMLDAIILKSGGHTSREDGMCFNEAAAYFAGEKHSDAPKCVCPVIRALTIRLNDRSNDAERQLLKPLIPVVVGTKTSRKVEIIRAYMAADFAIRVAVPRWFDLHDELKAHAVALRGVAPITTRAELIAARDAVLWPARTAARVLRDEKWAAYRERRRAAIDASAASAAEFKARIADTRAAERHRARAGDGCGAR